MLNQPIREMKPADFEVVYGFWLTTPGMGINDADTPEAFKRFLERNPGLSFLSEKDGEITGTVMVGHDGRRGYLYHLAVAVEYRKHGMGKVLVQKSLDALKLQKINKCHLFVFNNNTNAHAFYEATGWKKREDIIVFSKDL